MRIAAAVKRRRATAPVLKGLAGAAIAAALAAPAAAQNTVAVQAESGTPAGTNGGFILVPDLFSSGGQVFAPAVDDITDPPSATASYSVNFPAAGAYNLYTRVRVLTDSGSNDSLFVPADVGDAPAFQLINNFSAISTNDRDFYWVNLSTGAGVGVAGMTAQTAPVYNVAAAGPQTFVLGGREDGIFVDALVFSDQSFSTAAELDGLVAPRPANPPPPPAAGTFLPGPQGGNGFFGVREVTNSQSFENDTDGNRLEKSAQAMFDTAARNVEYTAPVVNMQDSGAGGNFGAPTEAAYRSSTLDGRRRGELNNVAMLATGTVRIPTAGTYTFGVNSDDGFRLTVLDPGTGQPVPFENPSTSGGPATTVNNGTLQVNAGRGTANSLGQVTFASPGDYPIQLLHFEGNGGAAVELFAATGAKDAFDGDFQLVGGQARTAVRKAPTLSPAGFDVVNFNNVTDPAGTPTRLDLAVEKYMAFLSDPVANPPDGRETNAPNIQYADPQNAGTNRGGQGDYPAVRPFPNESGVNEDNFGTGARGMISVTDPGRYTFDVLADDSIRFRLIQPDGQDVDLAGFAGGAGNGGVNTDADAANDAFRTTGCCTDALGFYDLATGDYTVELIHQEGGGGSSLSLFAAFGEHSAYDPAVFQLLGQGINTTTNIPAGLQLVPEPGSAGLLAGLGLLFLSRRRRRGA